MGQPRDEMPPHLPHRGHADDLDADQSATTGTQVAMPAALDVPGPPLPRRPMQPAPERQRPTLLPQGVEMAPKSPQAPRAADPALVRPGPAIESLRPRQQQESSDVIQMYDTAGSGEPRRATMHSLAPARTVPPAMSAPHPQAPSEAGPITPAQLPPQSRPAAQLRRVAQAAPPPRTPAPSAASVAGPTVLPLATDVMVTLIASHRSRLHVLDSYAKGLEIAAGIVGAVSGGLLIASLVGLLVSHGNTLIGAAAALASEVAGLGLTVAMLALAAGLRHLAASSAQVAALLEALSTDHR